MSHIDEGMLHAYLDGALEEYPTGTARRVRAHLERCEDCAERMDEARRLRDQAEAILALPELDVALPPLEELRRRARASEGTATPALARLYRLGWAASVVVALGVGWMIRGDVGAPVGSQSPRGADLASESPEAGSALESTSMAGELAEQEVEGSSEPLARGGFTEAGADPAPERVAAVVPAAPGPAASPSGPTTSVVDAWADAAPVGSAEALAALEPGPVPAPAARETERSLVVAEAIADDEVPANPTEPSAAGSARRTSEPGERQRVSEDTRVAFENRVDGASGGLVAGGLDASGRRPAVREPGEETEPGSLVVPGLEVLSIVWREEGVTPAGVRVLQQLEEGGTLELIHLPEGVEPGSVAPPDPGVRELVVPREQGWVILRAAVPDEVLVELLRRLEEPIDP